MKPTSQYELALNKFSVTRIDPSPQGMSLNPA